MEPFVSVLVPVRNEERYIERCLYSIARQDYPRERTEIIVIDGLSDDRTRQFIARFANESTADVRMFENTHKTPAAGMNIGLEAARGDIIMRLDGHAAMATDYVRRCVAALLDSGADCAGGVLQNEGETFTGRAIALAMSSRFGVGAAAFRTGGAGYVDTVAFGAYRSEVFDRIGHFAEDIDRGEDDEFNYRLRDAGGAILLVPEARVSYIVRGTLRGLWRQYFGYGRAKPEVLRRHPAQIRARQLIPPLFTATLAAALVRAIFGNRRPFAALILMYSGAATIVSLVLAMQHGMRRAPVLGAAFACMHISYGLGFLAGLLGLAGRTRVHGARSGAHQSTEAPG
jgi:cellulose synthase/poly-beta-1,6-N-acetylglucosamine synthase-like glycosyltransferase